MDESLNDVLFSVLVPAYKQRFFKECIFSVLAQSYGRFELIIVNDNSPEDLDSIVQEFSDDRILYYKNTQGFGAINVVGNWNRCLEYAKGDFVICMGDDDRLLPDCLEQYLSLINRYPNLDVYHARFDLIDEDSCIHKSNYVDKRKEYETTHELLMNRFKNRYQFIGDHLFRTSVLKENGGFVNFPCAWFSDEATVALLAGNKGIATTDRVAFQYRVNKRTISNNAALTDAKLRACEKARDWYMLFFESNSLYFQKNYEELVTLMNTRIRNVEDSCIASDISFGLFDGFFRWRKKCSFGRLLHIYVIAIRRIISRLFS